jgi:hypothetical protein
MTQEERDIIQKVKILLRTCDENIFATARNCLKYWMNYSDHKQKERKEHLTNQSEKGMFWSA